MEYFPLSPIFFCGTRISANNDTTRPAGALKTNQTGSFLAKKSYTVAEFRFAKPVLGIMEEAKKKENKQTEKSDEKEKDKEKGQQSSGKDKEKKEEQELVS